MSTTPHELGKKIVQDYVSDLLQHCDTDRTEVVNLASVLVRCQHCTDRCGGIDKCKNKLADQQPEMNPGRMA